MITRSDTVQESAGTSFTVKPPAPQPPPSTGQLTLTVKSVGGVKTTLSQFSALNTLQVSVGFGWLAVLECQMAALEVAYESASQ